MNTNGLLLMGHGTKSPHGQAQFLELVDLARQRFDGQVQGGFIELAQPSMFEAADELARSGISDLIIAPVILLPAGHLKDDAAELARHVRANWPNISVHLASDLGTNNELLDCFNQRINVVSDDADGILVVGRGSTDATANAELHAITRLITEARDYPITQTAFISLAPPTVTAGLEQLVKLGAHHIVVAPYFLFHGVLLDRIAEEALRWGADTGHRITVSAEFGPDPLVLDALWLRIREVSGEHVRTSCDTCLYRRTTLPLGTSA